MPEHRAAQPCCYCGRPVQGDYREIHRSWEKRRDQGGANRIIGRRETGRQACNECGRKLELGQDPDAPTLL